MIMNGKIAKQTRILWLLSKSFHDHWPERRKGAKTKNYLNVEQCWKFVNILTLIYVLSNKVFILQFIIVDHIL